MRSRRSAFALVALLVAAGCGGEEPGATSTRAKTGPAATSVPPEGYTCGELRSAGYRARQTEALLDEWGIEGARRTRLARRLDRALFRACDPGPDYRRAAKNVAREVLGPKP